MEFNSLLSKSAQKRIAEGEAPADAVKPIAQPAALTPEEIATADAHFAETCEKGVNISDLSKLSDAELERWLR